MKKIIVSTTINPVTEAIERYDNMADWHLIIAGDLKTPGNYQLRNGTYLTPQDQERIDPDLSRALGWNCIQRRNMALLMALREGADIVALIDDDNIPEPGWGQSLMVGELVSCDVYPCSDVCFDPIAVTDYPHLWHRGFPLQLLSTRSYAAPQKQMVAADIQADFWNGDPDIDAVCRMEHAPDCTFSDRHFPLASNQISPFNSQNTFMSRAAAKHYFLFPYCGRMDDIWPSFYLQALGYRVIYGRASVIQKRNAHDLTVDFVREVIGYENNLAMLQSLQQDPESIKRFLPGKTIYAWDLYKKHIDHLED